MGPARVRRFLVGGVLMVGGICCGVLTTLRLVSGTAWTASLALTFILAFAGMGIAGWNKGGA